MKKVLKKIIWMAGILTVTCLVIIYICNQIVVNNAEGKVFFDIDSIKYNKVGLLLGTTPQARITKVKNFSLSIASMLQKSCIRQGRLRRF